MSLGLLCDIVAHTLAIPASLKQTLLAETRVDRRVEVIRSVLHEAAQQRSAPFPPPFSMN
jgi:hypothetical protein